MKISVEQFISRWEKRNTRIGYQVSLNDFFVGFSKTTPEQYFAGNKTREDHEQDLHEFKTYLKNRGLSAKSIETKIGAVFSYFLANRCIDREVWKELKLSNTVTTNDRLPTKDELQSLLSHMDCRGRALYLVLTSSGMRLGDALSITTANLQLDKTPARIYLLSQKTQRKYYAFLSDEAVSALKEWLKIRGEYLQWSIQHCSARGREKKAEDDSRVFPFSVFSAHRIWTNALEGAGLLEKDGTTKRKTIHPHVLRKYFRTVAGLVLSQDVCEALLCHSNGLNKIYCRLDENTLATEYNKIHEKLIVCTTPVPDTTTADEITMLKEKLERQHRLIQDLNTGLRNLALTHQDPEVRKLWQGEQAR